MQIKGILPCCGAVPETTHKISAYLSPHSTLPFPLSCPKWGFQHKRNANDNSYNIIRLMAVTFIVKHPLSPSPPALTQPTNRHGGHLRRASLISVKCFLLFTFFGSATKQTTRPNCGGQDQAQAQEQPGGHTLVDTSVICNCFGYGVDFYLCTRNVTWPVSVINK